MEEKYYKYAELLLKKGLCIKEGEPLVISAPIESFPFVRVLTKVAMELGVRDIYFDYYDDEIKHTLLKYYDEDDIKKCICINLRCGSISQVKLIYLNKVFISKENENFL